MRRRKEEKEESKRIRRGGRCRVVGERAWSESGVVEACWGLELGWAEECGAHTPYDQCALAVQARRAGGQLTVVVVSVVQSN